jgi:hypothetical protein
LHVMLMENSYCRKGYQGGVTTAFTNPPLTSPGWRGGNIAKANEG